MIRPALPISARTCKVVAMELELSAEAKDKRLNRLVSITVVILSVATGMGNIKDGNIVQAMSQAQAASLDLICPLRAGLYFRSVLPHAYPGELAFCTYDPGPEQPLISSSGKVLSAGPNVSCIASDTPR